MTYVGDDWGRRARNFVDWGQRGLARPVEKRRSRLARRKAIRFFMDVGVVMTAHHAVTFDESNELLDDMAEALWAVGVTSEELQDAMRVPPRTIGGFIYTQRDWWPY